MFKRETPFHPHPLLPSLPAPARNEKKKKISTLTLPCCGCPGGAARLGAAAASCPISELVPQPRRDIPSGNSGTQHTDGGRELVPPSAALCPAWEVTPAPLRCRPALWGPLAAGRGQGQGDGTSRGSHCSLIVPVKPQGEIQSLRSGGESPVGAPLVPDPAR